MAWTTPSDLSDGSTLTSTIWNNFNGAAGNFDHLFDGTSIEADLVYQTSIAGGTAGDRAMLVVDDSETGGVSWKNPHQIHTLVTGAY